MDKMIYKDYSFGDFKTLLDSIKPNKNASRISPHKYVFLLTLLRIIEKNPSCTNKFYFGIELIDEFVTTWKSVLDSTTEGALLEHPYYHLVSSPIWNHKIKEGQYSLYNEYKLSRKPKLRFTPRRINETIEYGYLEENFFNALKNKHFYEKVVNYIQDIIASINTLNNFQNKNKEETYEEYNNVYADNDLINEYVFSSDDSTVGNNEFVSYLNTFHNLSPSNENSLAESQAQNKFFGSIHVPLDLTIFIKEQLLSDNNSHVILTGHAGDGKSTIGLELYKQLTNYPMDHPLERPMLPKEKVHLSNGITVHLIKDMSELSSDERFGIINSACTSKQDERFFIISNTGTLLSTLKSLIISKHSNWLDFENELLSLLQKIEPTSFKIEDTSFIIINLAQIDNLQTVSVLIDKIIHGDYWEKADLCPYKEICPISLNIRALKESYSISKERILSVYRLLYEYGHRLTLRQITAHIAYSITGCLNCGDIVKFSSLPTQPDASELLFHNTFFGFRGNYFEQDSSRLIPIQKIHSFAMCAKPYPPLERMLWFDDDAILPKIPATVSQFFNNLRNNIKEHKITVDKSRYRNQLRRFLFMFGDKHAALNQYLPIFVGSQMLYSFIEWQKDISKVSNSVIKQIKRKVIHVLQEQYTGITLPESCKYHYLFITLKRSNIELRQSVQILLKKIPISNFTLEFEPKAQSTKSQKYSLVLCEQVSKEKLILELPFLDFVMMRNSGEIGQKLNMSYLDRLERFKNLLLASKYYTDKNNLELIEYNSNSELKTYKFSFNNDIVEVSDAY